MSSRLDELQAAVDAATDGPWQVWRNRNGRSCFGPSVNYTVAETFHTSLEGGNTNARAIVLLRNNAADLLAVARAAQAYFADHAYAHGVALHDALAKLTGDV